MQATSSYQNSGSKVTKIAIVTLLHAGFALALLGMRGPQTDAPKEDGLIMVDPAPTIIDPPPPPPTVEAPPPQVAPPLYVPPTAIAPPNPVAPTLTTTNVLPTEPPPPIAGPAVIAEVVPPVAKVVESKDFRVSQTGNCAVPNYPANAARNGDEGTVGLALLISPEGRVTDSKVTSTSGSRELDRAAVAALSLCQFKPATTNGVPEAAWGKIAYVWTLQQ
jgi:protein TonB